MRCTRDCKLKKFFLTNRNAFISDTKLPPLPIPLPQGERVRKSRKQVERKKFSCVCIILILFLLAVGCGKSEVEILQARLDAFRNILPEKVREEFDSKNYEKVVVGFDSLLEYDSTFKEKYQKVKDQELINVFSPKEVVNFFKVYFVEEIEKLKVEKDSKW